MTNGTSVHSRRAVLAAALVAMSAVLARVMPARSQEDQAGGLNDMALEAPTRLTRQGSGPVFIADAAGPGVGVTGTSPSGIGVYGISRDGHGVLGSSISGSGVEAWSDDGWALRVRRGRIKADSVSGVAIIGTSSSSTQVRPGVAVSSSSMVLLSPRASLGGRDLWHSVQPEDRAFTVHVGEPVDADTPVAWFLLG